MSPDRTSRPTSTTSTRCVPRSLCRLESYRPSTTSSPPTHPDTPHIQWLNHARHQRILLVVSPDAVHFLPRCLKAQKDLRDLVGRLALVYSPETDYRPTPPKTQ